MATTLEMGDVRLTAEYSGGERREVTAVLSFSTWTGNLSVRLQAPETRAYPVRIDLYGPDGGVERYTLAQVGWDGSYATYVGGASRLAVLRA